MIFVSVFQLTDQLKEGVFRHYKPYERKSQMYWGQWKWGRWGGGMGYPSKRKRKRQKKKRNKNKNMCGKLFSIIQFHTHHIYSREMNWIFLLFPSINLLVFPFALISLFIRLHCSVGFFLSHFLCVCVFFLILYFKCVCVTRQPVSFKRQMFWWDEWKSLLLRWVISTHF